MNSKKIITTGFLLLAVSIVNGQNPPVVVEQPISAGEKWLALTPILFFILILCLIFIKLRKDKVSFKDLLLDKDAEIEIETQKTNQISTLVSNMQSTEALQLQPETRMKVNKIIEDIANPVGSDVKNNSSISRFLAFISGLVSVGLASSITSFYMWNFFDEGKQLNLNDLLTVLLSLGIGVIPYAFNKVGNALK